jgi:serine/threonine protein kinase
MGCVPTAEKHVQNFNKSILTSSNILIQPSPVVQQKVLKSQPNYSEFTVLKSRPFCEIILCVEKSTTSERLLKKYSKSIYSNLSSDFSVIFKNLEFLATLNHPNLLKTFEITQDDQFFYVFSEKFSESCLFSELINSKFIKENKLADIFYQICEALVYLHEKSLFFRDLSPENVQVVQQDGKFLIKLANLETSIIFDLKSEKKSLFSTFHFMAPEVLEERGSFKSDSWSLGMMLFVILSGKSPYSGKDSKTILKKLKKVPFRLTPSKYEDFSELVVNFLKKMMKPSPDLRSSIVEVLNHPWLSQRLDPDSCHPDQSLIHLLDFHIWSHLKISINTYISSLIQQNEDLLFLLQIFQQIDESRSGLILKSEFFTEIEKYYKNPIIFEISNKPELVINDQVDYQGVLFELTNFERGVSLETLNSNYKSFEFFDDSSFTPEEFRLILKFWAGKGEEVWQDLLKEAEFEGHIFLKDFLSYMIQTPSTLSSLKIVKTFKVEPF